jgi:hypothetical protein
MEAVFSSETSVNFSQTTWHHTPEDSSLLEYTDIFEIFRKTNI